MGIFTRNFETIERDIESRIQKLETDNAEYTKRVNENKIELTRLGKLQGRKEKKEEK